MQALNVSSRIKLSTSVRPRSAVVSKVPTRGIISLPEREALTNAALERIFNKVKSVPEWSKKPPTAAEFLNFAQTEDFARDIQIVHDIADLNLSLTEQRHDLPEYLGEPVRVAVTGAAGAISYSLLFRIASGEMLGRRTPVILQLLELPQALKALEGVVMELNDSAFPLLKGVTISSDPHKAFEGADVALLVGAKPRTKGMERGDLLKENAQIFSAQGKALNAVANRKTLKVLVVGNPANTNALIAARNAPDIDPRRFTAMTRLDHNRGIAQLADKLKVGINDFKRFAIWGNHSATQYPDISNTIVRLFDKEVEAKIKALDITKSSQRAEAEELSKTYVKWVKAKDLIKDEKWIKDEFIPTVQQRGAAIINARGASSAASAASAAIQHIRDWVGGTFKEWTSMGIYSSGEYGVDEGLYYSYPVVCELGHYSIVKNVPIDEFSAQRMEITRQELIQERDAVRSLLPK